MNKTAIALAASALWLLACSGDSDSPSNNSSSSGQTTSSGQTSSGGGEGGNTSSSGQGGADGGNGGTSAAGGSGTGGIGTGGNATGGMGGSGGSGGSPASGACASLQGPENWGTTYYVRSDGGDTGQCDGKSDAPYPGQGQALACAWNHPFMALPVQGPANIKGGDRLIIASGSYRMGIGAPGTGSCWAQGSYDCTSANIPSGPDAAHPTRIYGQGWDSGCGNKPELWGAERAWQILDLTGSDNVRIGCLELTDHAGCVEFHSGSIECERNNAPYGDWASIGLIASDSSDVTLCNLDIHGFAHTGIHAGRLHNWTVEKVRVAANGWVGWDGDINGADSNSGTMKFDQWVVEYNGCGETYPGGKPSNCWAQTAGGYGDGVGTGATGGDWIITDSVFRYNTSDGLDLLYHDGSGVIVLDRVRAIGNAGNQIKTRRSTTLRNSLIVGNCGFFDGKPFTYNVDNCRAFGNAVSITLHAGDSADVVNNTIYAEGDCIFELEANTCAGNESVAMRNNILLGGVEFLNKQSRACLHWSNCPSMPVSYSNDIVDGIKDNVCPSGQAILCQDPMLQSVAPESFNAHLKAGSPARDSGLAVGNGVPAQDLDGNPRPSGAGVDRGAYEM